MGFKEFAKKVGAEIKKASQKYDVNRQLSNQANEIKEGILGRLNYNDLRHLYRQFGGTREYIGGEEDPWTGERTPKRKMNKYDYVQFLVKKPYNKLVRVMRTVGRVRLADDMEREIEHLQGKASRKMKEIESTGVEIEEDKVLDAYVDKIIEEITSIPTKGMKNEKEYQIQLSGLFMGALKYSFKKQNPKVIMEHKTKTNRSIDILIQVGEYRIAVETKYNPQHSGEIQRAVGQAHEYSKEDIDAYILVSFYPIQDKVARENLRNLKETLPIPLKVIAGSRLISL